MKPLLQAILLVSLAMAGATAAGQAREGKDYVVVSGQAGSARADGKQGVEVLEFFSYACPHCARLEPMLEKWRRQLPPNVVLRRVPVTFGREEWKVLARLYYTLESLGQVDSLHAKVFGAIHDEHKMLFTPEAQADWMARQGRDRRAFLDAYNGFSVQARLAGANTLAQTYEIESVPSFVVAGRYRTDLDLTQGYEPLLKVADELVRKSMRATP